MTNQVQNIGKIKKYTMIFVKFYDKKSGSAEITYFSYDYDPDNQITIRELLNTWVAAKIGHNSFVIEDFGFELPEKCE